MKKSGEGPGGKFAGPSIREILKEHRLQQLESILSTNSIAVEFTDYMRSIRSVHQMCVAKNLDPNYSEIIQDFSQKFYSMFMEYGLSMTLKIHVIIHHYKYYFDKTGKTFKYTNGEFTESAHSSLRMSEEIHGLKIKRKLGTPKHQERSWQSMTLFNSKRAGFSTPIRLRKATPSPRAPSPRTPFSKKFLAKYPHLAEI